MEISPIPGIRALPAVKAPPADPRLSAVFDIENSSGPADDTYSGSGRKASGGTTRKKRACWKRNPIRNSPTPAPAEVSTSWLD